MSKSAYEKIIGKKIVEVIGMEEESDSILFKTECGINFEMYHDQDCCESVYVNDICGDKSDLIGGLVIHFEERTNCGDEESNDAPHEWCESFTWTFYDIQTTKGSVNIRWLGESNGYYSEIVEFKEVH